MPHFASFRSSSFAHAAMAFEDRISKLPRPSEVHRTRRAMSMTSQALDHEVLFVSPLVFKRRTSSASSLFTGSSNGLRSAADSWESLQNRQDVISGHATLNAERLVANYQTIIVRLVRRVKRGLLGDI